MTAPTSACHTKQPLGCRARRCGPSATTRRRPSPRSAGRPQSVALPLRGRPRPGRTTDGAPPGALPPCRVHGAATGRPRAVRRPAEKSISVGAARLPQIGGLSVGYLSLKPPDCVSLCGVSQPKVQLLTIDYSDRGCPFCEGQSNICLVSPQFAQPWVLLGDGQPWALILKKVKKLICFIPPGRHGHLEVTPTLGPTQRNPNLRYPAILGPCGLRRTMSSPRR